MWHRVVTNASRLPIPAPTVHSMRFIDWTCWLETKCEKSNDLRVNWLWDASSSLHVSICVTSLTDKKVKVVLSSAVLCHFWRVQYLSYNGKIDHALLDVPHIFIIFFIWISHEPTLALSLSTFADATVLNCSGTSYKPIFTLLIDFIFLLAMCNNRYFTWTLNCSYF